MRDREVSGYIEKQKSPQKQICKKLRGVILKNFPKIHEKIRIGIPWYGKYYIVSLIDSVNLGVSVKGLSKKDKDRFEGNGTWMRHLKFRELEDVDEKKIAKLLKLVEKGAECKSCFR